MGPISPFGVNNSFLQNSPTCRWGSSVRWLVGFSTAIFNAAEAPRAGSSTVDLTSKSHQPASSPRRHGQNYTVSCQLHQLREHV